MKDVSEIMKSVEEKCELIVKATLDKYFKLRKDVRRKVLLSYGVSVLHSFVSGFCLAMFMVVKKLEIPYLAYGLIDPKVFFLTLFVVSILISIYGDYVMRKSLGKI